MFEKVLLRNKKLCKRLIEICIRKKIKEIHYRESEKRIEPFYGKKWIRLDVYVVDEDGNIYDLELQISDKDKNIPRRMRQNHNLIGCDSLEPKEDFNNLKDVYVIFICLVDIYKHDEPVYRKRETIEGTYSLKEYDNNDGEHTIVLNAACPWLPNDDLGRFLRFLKTGIATDDFTKDLLHEVELVKQDKELEAEYMSYLEDLDNMSAEREAKMLVNDVQNLMKNLEIPVTLEKACKSLEHTVEEYNEALEFLKAEER